MDPEKNLLALVNDEDLNGFQWMNPPENFGSHDGAIQITADRSSDFFNNPETLERTATAPFLYRDVEGDFVATALVRPDFRAMWNAAALMVHMDSAHWIKFAFENSDATGRSIVSVVTQGTSDDANGAVVHEKEMVWLRMIRKGEVYAMHWSDNGVDFNMARLARLPGKGPVKVGMEAQSPVGDAVVHEFRYFSLEQHTVEDLRKGE